MDMNEKNNIIYTIGLIIFSLPWAKYLSICNIYWSDPGMLLLLDNHDPSWSNLSDVTMRYRVFP